MQLEFRTHKDALSAAASFVDTFVETHAVAAADTMALQLIVEELVANVLTHGGIAPDALAGTITLEAAGDHYRITLEDRGRPFDPLTQAPPDLAASLEAREVGGLGIHLCRRLTDEQRYERHDDRNVFTLLRRRSA